MKISQDDAILIKISIHQSSARMLLSELSGKGWKHGSIDSMLKRIRKTGTIRQPVSDIPRSTSSNGGLHAHLGRQAKNAPISS